MKEFTKLKLEGEYARDKLSFKVPSGILPKKIINYRNPYGKQLNLEQRFRQISREIVRDNYGSRNEMEFVKDFMKLNQIRNIPLRAKIYRQFIFPIVNRRLWFDCCNQYGVKSDRDLKANFFILDIIIPEYRYVIEVDSDYHNPESKAGRELIKAGKILHDPGFDKARDAYLFNYQNYRLRTIRVSGGYLIWDGKEYVGKKSDRLKNIFDIMISCEENIIFPRPEPQFDFSLAGFVALQHENKEVFDTLGVILKDQEPNLSGLTRNQINNIKKYARDIYKIELPRLKSL